MATETTRVLDTVGLFRGIPVQDRAVLAGEMTQRRCGRNELIFNQGDRGDGLYIVVDGQVSISRSNPDGDELIFGLYETGEYFGDLALFDDEPRSASATAVVPSTLLFLSRSDFRRFLVEHPDAVVTCLATISGMLRRCTDLADEVALLDIRSRMARRLLRLTEDVAPDVSGLRSCHITQQHLAGMLGATRESVNKHLNVLVDEGILRLERGHIAVLDPAGLEECAIGFHHSDGR